MKKISLIILSLLLCYGVAQAQSPSDTPVSQMEKLDRGLIAFPTTAGNCYVSWRLLGTDNNYTSFEVLKNGESYKKNIYTATSMTVSGKNTDNFQVVTFQNGQPVDTTAAVTPWKDSYLKLKLDRPAKENGYNYNPNDCSVGDVDGDGQYEIFVKWDPENSKDNSNTGSTNPVIIDCYRLDGTKLWRVNLGMNIRAGAHYTQFMVYDFNGDGKLDMAVSEPGQMGAVHLFYGGNAREKGVYDVLQKNGPQRFRKREEKDFPPLFRKLGWCTWDSLGHHVSEAEILRINRTFLNHHYVTDVISFNHRRPPVLPPGEPWTFGDIFVCYPVARKNARQFGHTFLQEMMMYVAHGALHLAGMNDDTQTARAEMDRQAEKIIAAVLKSR